MYQKLHDSTAVTLANEISQTIDDWELWDKIVDLCFDTTALNTGAKGEECKWMEQKVERNHTHLAFRHHISELILAHAFSLHDVSKFPNIEIFTRFKEPQIDQAGYCTALEESLAAVIALWKDNVIAFAVCQQKEFQPRDDYWNSQSYSLEVSLYGEYISSIQVQHIVLAGLREPFIP